MITKIKDKIEDTKIKEVIQEKNEMFSLYPENEDERKKIFQLMFDKKQSLNITNMWDLLPELLLHKKKGIAEKYIIEYITQYDKIKPKYIKGVEKVDKMHYTNLSKMIINYYKIDSKY
jgi:hypothetical protein